MVEGVEMFAGGPAVFTPEARAAGGRSIGFIVRRFIDSCQDALPLRDQPINPRFEIARGQQEASAFRSTQARKLPRLQEFRNFALAIRYTLAILVYQPENAPAFGEPDQIRDLLHELCFYPIMPRAARINLWLYCSALHACGGKETAGEG